MLIIRDMIFVGKRYFNELKDSDEKIASNILANRLNTLEESGIILKTKDVHHKQKNVYTLTEMGIDLLPIVIQMSAWSLAHRTVSEKDRAHVTGLIEGGQSLENEMRKKLLAELKEAREK